MTHGGKHHAAATLDAQTIARAIAEDGCIVVEGVLDAAFASRARAELERAIEQEVTYHKGKDYRDYGMVLACCTYGGAFNQLFDNDKLMLPFNTVLGAGCIVYAYTSSSMPAGGANYSHRIHQDCPRLIPGFPTNMGATILLDDFTLENGATYYLAGSHKSQVQPEEPAFLRDSRRLVAPKGSVLFFDALLWHMGGLNSTLTWRHALTLNMCRPFMKQRLDLPRMMEGMDLSTLSETALQKLGFRAQVPASLDEYYAPPEKRKYRQAVE
jgi:ectoine hydroxylase-related dioxygenase (phytanoyl-CoA dioxygenase family)